MLALRIDVSQADEIKMMQGWLEARGQEVPGLHAHHAQGAAEHEGVFVELRRLPPARPTPPDSSSAQHSPPRFRSSRPRCTPRQDGALRAPAGHSEEVDEAGVNGAVVSIFLQRFYAG